MAGAYTEDSEWRNRAEFVRGREAIREFLRRKWARELDYRLRKWVGLSSVALESLLLCAACFALLFLLCKPAHGACSRLLSVPWRQVDGRAAPRPAGRAGGPAGCGSGGCAVLSDGGCSYVWVQLGTVNTLFACRYLWAWQDNRISVCFEYEYHTKE